MIFDTLCEDIIGYHFENKMLLRQAFTHSSYAYEHSGEIKEKDNELLEFFGDAILQFIVTEYLFKNASGDEGKLTDKRKLIVSKEPLYACVKSLGLDKFLLLGKGQEKALKKDDKTIVKLVSSVYEALVGAIYLDGGLNQAKKFITKTIIKEFETQEKISAKKNKTNNQVKSELQEFVQKIKLGKLEYKTLEKIGPDHSPEYREAVIISGRKIADGRGTSKKTAQSKAAEKALAKLKKQEGKNN